MFRFNQRQIVLVALCFVVAVMAAGERKPIPLLVPDRTKTKVMIDERGAAAIRSIQGPVAIVTFLGRARSGKSFSLNYMLNESGFEVGHEDKAKTIGAAVWPFPVAGCQNHTILLIDTEGIGSGIQTYDKAMLLTTMAISSRLVYHNDGWLTYDDIVRLYSIACLAQHYDKRGALNDPALRGDLLPPISWVLQRYKFAGRLSESHSALDVLFKTWLMEYDNPDNIDSISTYNATVRAVKQLFPSHSVHLIASANSAEHVVVDEMNQDSVRLTDIPFDQLPYGYRTAMDALRGEVFGCQTTKAKGIGMTGSDIVDMLYSIIDDANEYVDYVGDRVVEVITRKLVVEAVKNANAAAQRITLPMESAALDLALEAIYKSAEENLINSMPLSPRKANAADDPTVVNPSRFIASVYTDDMRARFDAVKDTVASNNMRKSADMCNGIISELLSTIKSNDKRKKFDGDLEAYDIEFAKLVVRYRASARGPAASEYLRNLYDQGEPIRSVIAADGAHRRRIRWMFGSFAVIVVCHLASLATWIVPKETTVGKCIHAFAEAVLITGSCVAILAGWSIVGTPPVDFDYVADHLVSCWKVGRYLAFIGYKYRFEVCTISAIGVVLTWIYSFVSLRSARPSPSQQQQQQQQQQDKDDDSSGSADVIEQKPVCVATDAVVHPETVELNDTDSESDGALLADSF